MNVRQNIRQKIVESLKGQKNATIATVAKATGIERTVVRYHLKAMAKLGLAEVGRGTAGPNGSAPVSIFDVKKAAAFAADWEQRGRRATSARRGAQRRAEVARKRKSLGGGKGGDRQNGIGTSPKRSKTNGNGGETFLVTCDVRVSDDKVVHSVGVYHDKEQAIASAVANEGAVIWAARKLSVVHTLQEG
jgi:hypothetical protein